ncbi:MAG: hypothetical protein IKM05_06370 [Clostridia bacterium]|nr:hypothetical protein [Clostridia bacterium]
MIKMKTKAFVIFRQNLQQKNSRCEMRLFRLSKNLPWGCTKGLLPLRMESAAGALLLRGAPMALPISIYGRKNRVFNLLLEAENPILQYM